MLGLACRRSLPQLPPLPLTRTACLAAHRAWADPWSARLLRLAVLVLVAAAAVAAAQHRQLKIVNGWNAQRGRYPWAVSLRRPTGSHGHFCGGTLIAPRLVLTAAHCFWDRKKGRWTDQKPQVSGTAVQRMVSGGVRLPAHHLCSVRLVAAHARLGPLHAG